MAALAALGKPYFTLFDVNEICISGESVLLNGEQEITITKDNVHLWDSSIDSTVPGTSTTIGE